MAKHVTCQACLSAALADDASDKQNRDLSSSPRWSSHAQFVPETYILWAGPPDDDDFSAYQQLQQGSAIFLGWMLTGAFVLTGALYMQHRSFTGKLTSPSVLFRVLACI